MIFFIFEFLRIACTTERFLINDVLLLKNNFWNEDGSQIKTKEGFLFYVSVEIVDSKHSCFGDRCLPNISYYDSKNGKYLSVFKPRTSKEILSRLKNGQEVVLKFNFEFTDCPLLEINDFYIKKIDHFENYKILVKESENSIKFKVPSPDLYLIRIKQSIPIFFDNKFVILEKFNFDNVLIDQNLKIKLLYFESINSCLESFKKFVNHFNCLKIKNDKEENYCESDSSNNVLKVYDLKKDLQDKFNEDFKKNEKKFRDKYQFIERLFEEYCSVLIKELISDNIILPIKGKYNVKYYLDQFYSFLKDAIEDLLFVLNEDSDQDDVPFILWDYIWRGRKQTIRMCESIISNAWESLNVCDLFSGLLGRKISTVNDFIEVDKIICDYINMMRSVKGKEKYEINFVNSMIIENFECQLIRGIEIIFENSLELGKIKAFNSGREEIKLVKTVDYFENKNNNGICLTFEMIFERKISEIEIISKSGDFKECSVVKDDFTIKNKVLLLN